MSVKHGPRLERRWIDPFAIMIVERLQRKGFTAYLVGGCVRDLLAGIPPKDFDIVTSAHPQQVKDVIERAYIIGKRFRLVLVRRGQEQFEVATFRRDPPPEDSLNQDGLQVSDNVFGTAEEDARRRDFTVNSMFYDPVKDDVIDYCEGLQDIEARVIRVIGDPKVRLTEDPIRILRALRLAHKLHFSIEPSLREAMLEKAPLIKLSVLPRRREEMLKILRLPDPTITLHEAHDLGILQHAFPALDKLYEQQDKMGDFDSYLGRIHRVLKMDETDPTSLFGVLIFSYWRALHHADPMIDSHKSIRDEPQILEFMKNELGVFNLEASTIIRAIDLQPDLTMIDDYNRRGHRRKMGFLRNDALPLALTFAELDHLLSPADLKFWKTELNRISQN